MCIKFFLERLCSNKGSKKGSKEGSKKDSKKVLIESNMNFRM